MSTYRLTIDIELPDNISQDDVINFEAWLTHFNDCLHDDFYNSNPLSDEGYDIDVNSNWEEI